jgi:hypothetical protein
VSLGSLWGIQPAGFFAKAVDDIVDDLDAAMRAAFGASINTTPQARFGQLIGISAERYAELWALALSVYSSFDPNSATGVQLDNLAALTGSVRATPTPSTAIVTATGTPTTVLSSGRVVAVSGTSSLFQSTASGTITAVPAWATVAYLLTNRVTSGGNVWQCTQPGTATTAPTGAQGSTFTDGALTWLNLGSGTGAIDIPFSSELTGNIVAAAGGLTSIQTPVSGWSSAYNVSPAVPGVSVESDADFRVRRVAELHGAGKAAVEAIRAAVLLLSGIQTCTVFENPTDSTNGDGMPPHSVEVMVQGTTPALTLATAIFQNVAAGIATTGNQAPVTVTDSQGIAHSILYSFPTAEPIYITVNVICDPSVFDSVNGPLAIVSNLLAYGEALAADYDIFSSQLAAVILNGSTKLGIAGVAGVLDPGAPLIGLAPSPATSTTIPISSRQIGTFSAGRIIVNVSYASP